MRTSRAIEDNSLSLQRLSQDAGRYQEFAERAATRFQRRLTKNVDAIQAVSGGVSSLQNITENVFSRVQAAGVRIQNVAEAIRTELTDFRECQSRDHYESKLNIMNGLSSIEREQRCQSRAYQASQITLEDIRNKADELIKIGNIEQKSSGDTTGSRDHAIVRSRTTIERTLYFRYLCWSLPIGKLYIQTTR